MGTRSPCARLVLALHKVLNDQHLTCVGVGDESEGDTKPTQEGKLPEGWDKDESVWVLRYRQSAPESRSSCTVKALKLGDALVVNAMVDGREDSACDCTLDVADYIDTDGEMETLKLRRAVLESLAPLFGDTSATGEGKPAPRLHPDDLRRRPPETQGDPLRLPQRGGESTGGRAPFGGYGDADWKPSFGPSPPGVFPHGGMYMDPYNPDFGMRPMPGQGTPEPFGLPRGAVPPGARFDPFGPGTGLRGPGQSDPDPDDLPPPGGYNNMFL